MVHLALYRTWRPRRFEEVVGQTQTVLALKNSVRLNQTSHAYLFAGPRGTGKTSLAKIFARALNCEHNMEGEPCNVCESCQEILNGNFMDVIEIDAASNRGIDEIRDLREQVKILPAMGHKKVYIIDEVHMLTTEAFNALLKTLEEPPENVIFILATTEVQKIPATILSRCQRYNFLRLSLEEIAQRLGEVAEHESMPVEKDALELIAKYANGGMRDALGILDQVITTANGTITRNDVMEILGIANDTFFAELFDAVKQDSPEIIMMKIAEALHKGWEARQIARESAIYLRDGLMILLLGDRAELQFVGLDRREILSNQVKDLERISLVHAIKRFMELSEKLRYGEDPRFLLEMAFLDVIDILKRPLVKPDSTAITVKQNKKASVLPSEKKEKALVGEEPGSITRVAGSENTILWEKVLAVVKKKKITTHAILHEGNFIGINDNTAYISYRKGYRFHKERMEEKENKALVTAAFREVTGNEVITVEFMLNEEEKYNQLLIKKAIEIFGKENVRVTEP